MLGEIGTAGDTRDEQAWIDDELSGCKFEDARLGKRLAQLMRRLSGKVGGTIPLACQDWANTKAAYRFLSNERVDEQTILAGHFQSTRQRVDASVGPLLILQDTTEFSYKRDAPERIGFTGETNSRRDKAGRLRRHTVCGLLMHSSLAVTSDGLPLGLCAIKFWSRKKFKVSGKPAALFPRVTVLRRIAPCSTHGEQCRWKRASGGGWVSRGGVRCCGASMPRVRRWSSSAGARA